MRFTPHLTVACIVERQGRFLIVEEERDGKRVLNQPAGHLEAGETLLQAAVRETREETGWRVELIAVTGLYLFTAANGVTYQRACFSARPLDHDAQQPLDDGIVRARWMTLEELQQAQQHLRSHLVLDCILDYLNKPHYSLDLIR
ncbi:NUDIX hydrolase [Halopseudomonas sp.]|uniref:NUDIX hydrolase n=1 Tax=Halopseudomonas sp. TaxID=2901191 RepID=UPI003001508A